MTTPLRVLCSLCWAIVVTYLASWFIIGTPNLIHLHWAGKVCILVVGGIAWACIDIGWKDMRWDDQLDYGDRKSKQSEKLKPVEETVASTWEKCRETNSSHSLPPHLSAATDPSKEFGRSRSMAKGEWEESIVQFCQSPPKPAPRHKGKGYQPVGGSEATPPKDE